MPSVQSFITFGEGIVGMTDFFDVKNFSLSPILVFCVIFGLFACYVTQIHYLCNHNRTERSLRLMFSQYFIVISISINLVTIAFKFLENHDANTMFTAILMSLALVLFFISIFADSVYYHERFKFEIRDGLVCATFLAARALIMSVLRDNIYCFLLGTLTAVLGNLIMLLYKYKKGNESLMT